MSQHHGHRSRCPGSGGAAAAARPGACAGPTAAATLAAGGRWPAGAAGVTGFGMIEVLVAMVVVGIAMFGTAKLQALSIGATRNSATRSMVALQAASLGAAMRANEAYWSSTLVPTVVSSFSGGVTTLDSTLAGLSTDCTATLCTAQQQASYDVRQWLAGVTAQNPSAGANISCAAATSLNPVTCTVEVDWTEKAIAANAATLAGATPTVFKYQLLVMP